MFGLTISNPFAKRRPALVKYGNSPFTRECVRITNFRADKKLIRSLKRQWQEYAGNIPSYPGHFKGKGIVICAGGITYFTCAWVNVTLLRENGCTLPIEIWYAGNELTDEVIEAFAGLGATCKRCDDYTKLDVRRLALKPFSILHSSFKEVLFLDADINTLADPAYLFEDSNYLRHGAVFWPDFWTTDRDNPIWEIVDADNYDSFEQESGQVLVNKEKSWKELNLCLYYNLNSEYYYKMLMGDKDTFKFAWQALRSPYYMIPTPTGFCGFDEPGIGFCGLSMVQHDFSGNIIFLHRNWFKWDITREDEPLWQEIRQFRSGSRERVFSFTEIFRDNAKLTFFDFQGDIRSTGFQELFGDYEQRCLSILKELRATDLYARFLLHTYFVHFRPGYRKGYMENILLTPSPVCAPEDIK